MELRARASWDVAVKFHYSLLSKSGLKSIKKQEAWGLGGRYFFSRKLLRRTVHCDAVHQSRENNRGDVSVIGDAHNSLKQSTPLSTSLCVQSVTSNPPHQPLQANAGFSWMVLRCLATLLGSMLYITHRAGYYGVAGWLPVIFLCYKICIFCSPADAAPRRLRDAASQMDMCSSWQL